MSADTGTPSGSEAPPTLPLGDLLALGSQLRADDTPESLLADLDYRVVSAPSGSVRRVKLPWVS